jgi:hypothetical protein
VGFVLTWLFGIGWFGGKMKGCLGVAGWFIYAFVKFDLDKEDFDFVRDGQWRDTEGFIELCFSARRILL